MALGVALRLAGPPLIAIALLALMRKVRRAEATVNLPRASVQKPWMKCSEGRHYRDFLHNARAFFYICFSSVFFIFGGPGGTPGSPGGMQRSTRGEEKSTDVAQAVPTSILHR